LPDVATSAATRRRPTPPAWRLSLREVSLPEVMSNFWEWLSHEFHEVLPLAAIWVHEGVRAAGSDLTGVVASPSCQPLIHVESADFT
jgi:hypothetical protein